ncbi:MAG: PadR family transcriptional regulator [Dehalococcoidia bacterium]
MDTGKHGHREAAVPPLPRLRDNADPGTGPIPADHRPAELSPAQYAILGLLYDQPTHGYGLQRAFAAGGELADVAQIGQPALYAALKELVARALIAGQEEREGARPLRTTYALTPRGEASLLDWLRQPVPRLRQVRLDFLLKVYFARRRGVRVVRALVDAQIRVCHDYLARLEERAAQLSPDDFAYLVVESRTTAARSTLDWLHAYRRRL